MFELTIKVSNEEKRTTKKTMCYEADIVLSRDDKTLCGLVEEAVQDFNDQVDDVKVVISFSW